MRAKFME